MNNYQEAGYKSRYEYLLSLAEEYSAPMFTVVLMADILGPSEDFDGLVSALEDLEMEQDFS